MWIILSKSKCPHCIQAREFLESRGYYVNVLNLSHEDNNWLLNLVKRSDIKTVPQIFRPDGTLVGGFTELKELVTEGPL